VRAILPAAATFLVVSLAWVPFRAPDALTAWVYMTNLFAGSGSASLTLTPWVWLAFLGFVVDHGIGFLMEHRPALVVRATAPLRGATAFALTVMLWQAAPQASRDFIYFRF
jgi:hypothetical protein